METLTLNKNQDVLDIRDLSVLENSFNLVDDIVTKKYLDKLNNYELIKVNTDDRRIFDTACMFRVKKIVYDRNENNLQKLVNTYASSVGFHSNIVMIINSDGKSVDIYLGTTGATEISSARASAKALYNNFIGNFPGSLSNFDDMVLDNLQLESLLRKCTKDFYSSVSSVSGIGSTRTEQDVENNHYIQGIEKMIDSMQGVAFSAIFIANLIDKDQIEDIKAEYEALYSKLFPFLKSELSFNESFSEGITKTLSESLSETVSMSKSTALSSGETKSSSHSEGHSEGDTTSENVSHTRGKSKGRSKSINGVGASRGKFSSTTIGVTYSSNKSKSWSDSTSFGTTNSKTKSIAESTSKGKSTSETEGITDTNTNGRSLQISYLNKTIQNLLEQIDEQLERIKESENYGIFSAAAYFLAPTPLIAKMAASSYKSLINGSCTHIESARINSWEEEKDVNIIKQYLQKLQHPLFTYDNLNVITPASIVSSKELAVQMGLPRKSISGVSVIETAEFGRNIVYDVKRNSRYIEIGNLYHMGREEKGVNGSIPVKLDIDSLTMHTFITGSTGSGKSNTIYSLLEKVLERSEYFEKNPITFLVIEPAKGEYKDKFGNKKNVRVLGTNNKKSELLRINPFSFPSDIHVLEHIDRLIEIFNVCWPMYAAMPAVLKDAIERSYKNSGWDLSTSECKYKDLAGNNIYPNFLDVLIQINLVMEESKYSSDSKGDYVGALSTRVKSLTNGIYGQIFTNNDLSMEELFDNNVIVDLSRVGSMETKSLIMGLLVMKMQEYRMSYRNENNVGLRHLTVLEEAHNLLRRTSTEQSSDSSNLLGKSVEMLANSIAEMRTYGEGFIIADQAPGLLDMSVIRNTNTKIILRLPDMSDRELVGRAASLNDNQIQELSKLGTGVAAIYQNNWLEPVLCKIYPCKNDERKYEYNKSNIIDDKLNIHCVIDYLMLPAYKKLQIDVNKIDDIEKCIFNLSIPSYTKVLLLKYIKESNIENIQKMRNKIIFHLFNSKTALSLSNIESNSIESWYNVMIEKLEPNIMTFDTTIQSKILAILANEQAIQNKDSESVQLFENLISYINCK